MYEIVGQDNLKNLLSKLASENKLPQFILLEGRKGSGRKLMAEYIAELLNAPIIQEDSKIDNVRAMIDDSQNISSNRMYLIPEADNITIQAENALLKLAEEPPAYFYIVLTIEDRNNILPTILSRATLYRMEEYTPFQLKEFTEDKLKLDICTTPGQIFKFTDDELKEVYDFAKKVVDNLGVVSIINLFNISNYLDIDGKGTGYDINLFFDTLEYVIYKCTPDYQIMCKQLSVIAHYRQMFTNKSINKLAAMDMFLLQLKGV